MLDYESLFLQSQVDLTPEQEQAKLEQQANLAHNFALQEVLDVSIRVSVVEALTLLGERKFEEAYTALVSSARTMEIKNQFLSSAEKLQQEKSVKETETPNPNSIKY